MQSYSKGAQGLTV